MAKLVLSSERLNPGALKASDYVSRMWVYWQIGEKEKSLINANRALNLDPDNFLVLNCRVYLLADLKRYAEGLDALQRFIEVDQSIAFYPQGSPKKK